MSACLLLRLAGPLQSWGYRSRFSDRDTGAEPTKSGVVGLLCCAMGRNRRTPPTDMAQLRMHVRVDREGTLLKDFHTAGGGRFRGSTDYFAPTSSGGKAHNPVVTERHYLQEASFLVALEGDEALLKELACGLADPVWPLALGRRSCPPAEPVLVGLRARPAADALREEPLPDGLSVPSRYVWELPPGDLQGEARRDVPIAWPDRLDRRYGLRYVRSEQP